MARPTGRANDLAELLERCANAAFDRGLHRGRRLYRQKPSRGVATGTFRPNRGRPTQRYVGPETPELLAQIEHHKTVRDDERTALEPWCLHSCGHTTCPAIARIGDIFADWPGGRIFRCRAVLSARSPTRPYSAMLGIRLSASLLQTAGRRHRASQGRIGCRRGQHRRRSWTSCAKLTKLRDVPKRIGHRRSTSYVAKDGIPRLFLTPPAELTPQAAILPSLKTDAQPLPFSRLFIYQPEPAVILHRMMLYVQGPRARALPYLPVHKI